ncbi:MAG: hypothetical protein KA250_07145 [Verrucomicrobiales bacterium]|jgi:hypothetical protein|nr:hypothetical protein [Verrucomicrobiales bacterium]MBP9225342.1 hypothetical protein [Verrucomicrobiales bacterium]
MRLIRYLFLLICILITTGIVWGAIYARKEGFTRSWREAIQQEFANRGYYVEIGKLTLGAFRGLVAEDVRFFQDKSRSQEIAFIDDVYLNVDLSHIFNEKQISINTLDVQEASLSLPLDLTKPDGRRIKVSGLSGRVVITESVIEIVKAEASMIGVDLSIKGSLVRDPANEIAVPESKVGSAAAESLAQRHRQFVQFLHQFENYEFLDGRPKLAIEFRADLADLSTMTARAEMKSGALSKKGQTYRVESVAAVVSYDGREHRARIESLRIADAKGVVDLTGDWSEADGHLNFSLESKADMASLIGLFRSDKRLGEVVFFNPPEIKASGYLLPASFKDASVGFPGEVIGKLRAEKFVTRGTVFSGLDFGFSAAGNRFYVRNLRLDHQTGVAFLNLKYEPGLGPETIQYQTEIKLDPLVFRPFFDEPGRKFIDAWNFGEAATIYIAAIGQGGDWHPLTWENRGTIDLRHFRLQGVPFLEMETEFETTGDTQWFRNVSLVREEGKIYAELAQNNVKAKQWEVKGVVSTVDPVEGARAFSPLLATALGKYRHSSPPTIRMAGLLDGRRDEEVGEDARRNELAISFIGSGTSQYDFLGKTLTLSDPIGEVVVSGSRVHLTKLTAGVFGGKIDFEYDAKNVRSKELPFEVNMQVTDVPLEAVTKHYGDRDAIKGLVTSRFQLRGNAGQIGSIYGSGSAKIANGYLFSLPVLGPLSKIISDGKGEDDDAGHSVSKEASATFRIEKGIILSDDIEALTHAFRVRAAGTVSLIDSSVDLEAVVNTRGGLSSAILTPVSELLTYSCTGTITDPVWKPKHISNLVKIPTHLISDITNIPIEGLKMIGKGIFGSQEKRDSDEASQRPNPEANPKGGKPFPRLFPRRQE